MFRISIFVLVTFFSCILFAQDTLNITDSKGHKQGYWRKLDSGGRVVYDGRFRDGVPEGVFRYFYPDGKLKTVSTVSIQGKRAVTVSYFPNGMKMAAGNYLNEKKDSIWQFFSESNGDLVSEETYLTGLIHGQSKVFYPEGGVSELRLYKNGIKEGLWEQYYPDGKLKLRGNFQAGDNQGAFMIFYNSGQPMVQGRYAEGHKDGIWMYYDEKGAIAKKESYDRGKLLKVEPETK